MQNLHTNSDVHNNESKMKNNVGNDHGEGGRGNVFSSMKLTMG